MRRIICFTAIAVAAVAVGAGLASASGTTKTVSVPATSAPVRGFTGETAPVNSGVTLVSGQQIVVTASGSWSVGGGLTTSPTGTSATCASAGGGCPVNSAGQGALIGSLNGGASWFAIGSGPMTIGGTGTLLLAANDIWNGDNSGSINVNIAIGPLPPTNASQCKNGGWQTFGIFKNQGDCTNYVNK